MANSSVWRDRLSRPNVSLEAGPSQLRFAKQSVGAGEVDVMRKLNDAEISDSKVS